jgi:hypothetical protein
VIGPAFVLDFGFFFARHQFGATYRIAFHDQPPSCTLLQVLPDSVEIATSALTELVMHEATRWIVGGC